ncbi:MAG: universal stress protein [Actinomycetota bacterium]|jgi:nucleotide-binding universal stress UspA family protein|nr:universal stress protein [Actinomycetota bacterium]MDA8280576.1 universal stress protein [Actinomycetota bacterium]
MLRRLLVGFDGSDDARAAVRTAVDLASATTGGVAVVAVVPNSRGETESDRSSAFDAEAGPLRDQAERQVASCGRPDVPVTVEAVGGDHPGGVLLAYATRTGSDLLLVGRHGREHAMHSGLGRVTRELVERAQIGVLVVSAHGQRTS